jgi:hypothetical protein
MKPFNIIKLPEYFVDIHYYGYDFGDGYGNGCGSGYGYSQGVGYGESYGCGYSNGYNRYPKSLL